MEAIAAVSNVASIISLAVNAVNGTITLRGFFKDYASASKSVDRFLCELNSLIQTLKDVTDIVLKLDNMSSFEEKAILLSLEGQLRDCEKDVYGWVRIGSEYRPRSVSGSKAMFKKFLVAVNKERITDIFRDIASHKANISLKLSMLGSSGLTSPLTSLDIKTATYVESIFSKVNEIGTATASTNQVTTDALQRLEVQLATERPETPDTPSLKSLASAISRIENMLSSQQGSIASPRSSPGGSSTGSRRRSVAYPRVGSPRSEAGSAGSSAGSPNDLKRHESHSMFVRRSNSFQNNEPKDTWPPMPPEVKLASGMGSAQELESLKVEKERMDNIILQSQLPLSISNSPDVKLDEHITSRGDKNKITDTVLGGYAALLGVFRGSCPEALLGYFKLVCYFRVVALHSRLLASMQNTESRGEITDMDEYRRVQTHLETLKQDIEQARDKCWKEGYNLDEIDIILDSDCLHETLERKVLEGPREDIELLALRKRLHLLRWSNKLERINAWLLQKLASSREEVTLHRSFLPNSRDLVEKQWARLVVKFWPLDKAGEEDEKKSLSTNEAVHSGKGKNTVRVFVGNDDSLVPDH